MSAISAGNTLSTSLIYTGDNTATLSLQTNSVSGLNINSSQNANCTSTGAFRIPVGTAAQRPSSPINGMIRLNTTINKIEGYANNSWVAFT